MKRCLSPRRARSLPSLTLNLMLRASLSLGLLAGVAACGSKTETAEASPTAKGDPAPPDGFCEFEPDGEYLNSTGCRSTVVCEKKEIVEVKQCPPGQAINSILRDQQLRCQPLEEAGLDENCRITRPPPRPDFAPPPEPVPNVPLTPADGA